MERRILIWFLVGGFLILLLGWLAVSQFSLSALDDPGRLETYLATKAKRFLVARGARSSGGARNVPPPPLIDPISVMRGRMNFTARCATCHGYDGRTPTDIGRSLYPRTPDLGLPAVQQYSDAELFWIIKHGIRLTGMPAFGKIHSDEEISHLVAYVRSLAAD
jgi:mono/diheme cytochrome c family protein